MYFVRVSVNNQRIVYCETVKYLGTRVHVFFFFLSRQKFLSTSLKCVKVLVKVRERVK